MARSLRAEAPSAAGLGRRGFLAALLASSGASALGRTPYGGRLRLTIPWPISGLDPASLDGGFGALFASAAFESLFGLDASGAPYPTLADALPSKLGEGCKVTLRTGLRSAAGRALTATDLLATLSRARSRGAIGLLGELEQPTQDPHDPLSVSFARSTPDQVARALASPLLALVPRSFSPLAPDGTGAFKVELAPGRALFTRNPLAARGAAFLEAIEVRAVRDLAELLRGFEAGETDVGWFGTGLYRTVKDAQSFAAPRYACAVLLPGKLAGAWGAPGALQALLDTVPATKLAHLGVQGSPTATGGGGGWGGPATNLVVLDSAPQLGAIARVLASSLSTPGHELTVVEKTASELADLQTSKQFGLMLDAVRLPPGAPREAELLLRTAASPEAAKKAPKTAPLGPRELGRQLPLGVVGELSLWGARRASLVGLESWQLGSVWIKPG